jgi:hypothetical protein
MVIILINVLLIVSAVGAKPGKYAPTITPDKIATNTWKVKLVANRFILVLTSIGNKYHAPNTASGQIKNLCSYVIWLKPLMFVYSIRPINGAAMNSCHRCWFWV